MKKDKLLFVSAQKDENILIPTQDDYYKIGTIVKIKQMLKIQGDSVRVLVEGLHRGNHPRRRAGGALYKSSGGGGAVHCTLRLTIWSWKP